MEGNESNQEMQSQSAILCKAGCGFYGSSSSDGYCSVCFKEKLQRCLLHNDVPTTASSSTSSSVASSDVDSNREDDGKLQTDEIASGANLNPEPAKPRPADGTPTVASNLNPEEVADHLPADAEENKLHPALDPSEVSQEVKGEEDEEDKVKVAEGENLKKRNRCFVCKKKVGLTGFGCRCGGLFCGLHRYSDTHECKFDYKEQGQQEIRKNNPRITFQKVAKI